MYLVRLVSVAKVLSMGDFVSYTVVLMASEEAQVSLLAEWILVFVPPV